MNVAIPGFQQTMLPALALAADDGIHSFSAAVLALADRFNLTDEERVELLPSGRQALFTNRVAWALFHLRHAGLLASIGRGKFRITARGHEVLAAAPEYIDLKFLMRCPEFRAFRERKGGDGEAVIPSADGATQTPEETFDASYQSLRAAIEEDLLDRVKAAKPQQFERWVVQLMLAMGYGGSQHDAGKAVGQTGDGGIDGVIKEDRLGLDSIYLQAKRWEGTVGRPVVQAFAGSLDGRHAHRGVLITTSSFSADARTYVAGIEKRIVLVDGKEFARLMFEWGGRGRGGRPTVRPETGRSRLLRRRVTQPRPTPAPAVHRNRVG